LFYEHDLVKNLCGQADLIGETVIPTMLCPMSGYDITFTLYPSEINVNFLSAEIACITWGKGHQAWKGNMHHIGRVLRDARLQNGETVCSVASHIFPHWQINEGEPPQIETWSRSGW
jgi:hypothetical protein